ncbi:MAG TPA: peptidylprolyl isomerase [Candidatus Deferrimicrobium sp.]|nr:peptidylprolyl isomerase [Candidatus Deferrimicrobium sp.]
MADRNPTPPAQRPPFALAAGALLVGALVVAIIFINKANGLPAASIVSPSPASASASPTSPPSPTPANIPYADCSTATFGPNLQPVGEPADPHVYSAPPATQVDTTKLYRVTITTARGTMLLCLQPDLAPATVNNFVVLTRNHFYDGLKFHRVVAGFVDQGGDPQGTGNGGPGYQFKDEPVRQQYVLGALAMANSGKNTNGSQFFICIADDTSSLAPNYNLFGKLYSGIDVAQKVVQGDVMQTVTVAQQQ